MENLKSSSYLICFPVWIPKYNFLPLGPSKSSTISTEISVAGFLPILLHEANSDAGCFDLEIPGSEPTREQGAVSHLSAMVCSPAKCQWQPFLSSTAGFGLPRVLHFLFQLLLNECMQVVWQCWQSYKIAIRSTRS